MAGATFKQWYSDWNGTCIIQTSCRLSAHLPYGRSNLIIARQFHDTVNIDRDAHLYSSVQTCSPGDRGGWCRDRIPTPQTRAASRLDYRSSCAVFVVPARETLKTSLTQRPFSNISLSGHQNFNHESKILFPLISFTSSRDWFKISSSDAVPSWHCYSVASYAHPLMPEVLILGTPLCSHVRVMARYLPGASFQLHSVYRAATHW